MLLGGAIGGALLWFHQALLPVGPGEARLIEVPKGAGCQYIAALLHREGLIRNQVAFQLALKRWGLTSALQAGYYELAPHMSAKEIASLLASGHVATVKIIVPEGFTRSQIAQRVAQAGLCSEEEFLAAAVPPTVADLGLPLRGNSLEGFLFPDTYVFEYGTEPSAMVKAMVRQFKQRIVKGMAADLAQTTRSLLEIVTIASLIEEEAHVEKDRALIASVIYNRLNRGMPLQIDATVLYALGKHKPRLTYRDLTVDSPFNTYRHKGLPPHPITNPGEASIRAALHPARTEFLFYVAKPDGSHQFTKTYVEHQRAIRAIRGSD
ncbi:MAG: endolytic transglycosylase MltG [Candidatus Zipacnadales bacterium]